MKQRGFFPVLWAFACVLIVSGTAGCASKDPILTRPDVGPRKERTVLAAITEVKASDTQRTAILKAYDARNDQLSALEHESHEILARWHQIDRLSPDFNQQIDELSVRWAQVNADEMKTRAGFEHDVALALDAGQWSHWQSYMRSHSDKPGLEDDGETRHRHRPDLD